MTVASADGPAIAGIASGTISGSLPVCVPKTPSGCEKTMRSAIRNRITPPAIVSDVGWYAELPECVLKVPSGESAGESLVEHLSRLAADRNELAALSGATRRYAASNLDFDTTIGRYVGIVSELAVERARRSVLERALCADAALALSDLNLSERGSERAIRAELLRILATCL